MSWLFAALAAVGGAIMAALFGGRRRRQLVSDLDQAVREKEVAQTNAIAEKAGREIQERVSKELVELTDRAREDLREIPELSDAELDARLEKTRKRVEQLKKEMGL